MFFSFCVRCRRARATLTRRRLCGCAVCALVVVAGGAAQGLLCRYYRSMRGATSTTRFHSFGGGCCCFCFIPGNGRNLCDIYDVWKSCKVHKNEEKLNFSSAVVVFFCFGLIICRTTLLSERQRALASLFEHFICFVLLWHCVVVAVSVGSERPCECHIGVPSCTRRLEYVHEPMNI